LLIGALIAFLTTLIVALLALAFSILRMDRLAVTADAVSRAVAPLAASAKPDDMRARLDLLRAGSDISRIEIYRGDELWVATGRVIPTATHASPTRLALTGIVLATSRRWRGHEPEGLSRSPDGLPGLQIEQGEFDRIGAIAESGDYAAGRHCRVQTHIDFGCPINRTSPEIECCQLAEVLLVPNSRNAKDVGAKGDRPMGH